MREILFRGKRVDNGEWVYGAYYGLCRITNKDGGFGYEHLMRQSNNEPLYMVAPETVGEYTGLTDKNGKKIFEGDILKVYETQEHAQNVSVSYENGQFVVSHYALKLLSDRVLQSEVIGTIYDNPELLEVEE